MSSIKEVHAKMIFDSRGVPTVEAFVTLDDGTVAKSSAPSGASTGSYEAVELRDHDEKDYNGKGVSKAIENVEMIIAPSLVGKDPFNQQDIDRSMIALDDTSNKGKLGANAILPVSQAVAKAAAFSKKVPLYKHIRQITNATDGTFNMPTPLFNILEGGAHADNGVDFQDYMIIPAISKSFEDKMKMGADIYSSLKKSLADQNMSTLIADEGGFAPDLANNTDACILVKNAVERAGYQFALDAFVGIDAASNHFKDQQKYKLIEKNSSLTPEELIAYYVALANEYSLIYLEDPFAEDDMESWKKLRTQLSANTMIVGDYLTVTNPFRLQAAIDANSISGIVIKPNQIGTVTEAMAVVQIAKFTKLKIVVSHRSGETTDDFIADFAIGVGADYIKFGSPAHERVAKYNRVLEIMYELASLDKKTEQ
jgi:enolase